MLRTLLAVLAVVVVIGVAQAADHAWMEGESPSESNYDVPVAGWGNPQFMSGGKWAHLAGGDAKKVPDEGVKLAYDFQVPSRGAYEVWARLGFERLRFPFRWRIDDGSWREVGKTHYPILDVMPIQEFNKLAWTRLDTVDLSAGKHTLHIRLARPTAADKKAKRRFLWALDALCVHKGAWRPNGKVKPSEAWKTERDKRAAEHVFRLGGAPAGGQRASVTLEGVWQVARWDQPGAIDPETRLGPIARTPDARTLHWGSIEVPGDRDDLRPDLADAHRFFYRTRVFVPSGHKGRAFHLVVPMHSMITTVFVNGKRCGWSKAPFASFRVDLTDAIVPGQANELWIGVKDFYYGVSPKLTPAGTTREWWFRPLATNAGYMTNVMDMPVALMWHTGLLDRPELVSTGRVYAADVFPQPSVAKKSLGLEITLRNPTDRAMKVTVDNELVPHGAADAQADKTFARVTATVPAGGETALVLREDWGDPRLWWPDDPFLYDVVTTVRAGGEAADVRRTRMGFREWDWSTPRLKLNGIAWKLWHNHGYHHVGTPDEALAKMRKDHCNTSRWRVGLGSLKNWNGLNYREYLEYCDENGIIVRTTSPWDGMFVNYNLRPQQNPEIWDHAEHMIVQWAKGVRNHPSIACWSLQNEIVLINGRNIKTYGPLMGNISQAVMEIDPTRPTMNDGAGDADPRVPINGLHYPENKAVRLYPDEAYTWEHSGKGHRRMAPPDPDKPTWCGESYYTGGKSIGWFASVGGEECFRGIAHCQDARATMAKILVEGFRWQGIAAADFLTAPSPHNNSLSDVAVFCRQWDWTHASGATVPRRMKLLNMTRYDSPIDVSWTLTFEGKTVDSGSKTFTVAPGTGEEFDVTVTMPQTDRRLEGRWTLSCRRDGEEVFRDVKHVSVIDPDAAKAPKVSRGEVAVFDPSGTVQKRLARRGVAYSEVSDPLKLPGGARVVIVGPDALDDKGAKDPAWGALAATGKRILVLDQANPLIGKAVGGKFKLTGHTGRIAFMETPSHAAFEGLEQKDFFCRQGDHITYRTVYEKPSEGALSLMQCDEGLASSALLEAQVGEGLMLLCQAVAGSKLDADPVAQRLFDNLLNYALAYERIVRRVAVVADDGAKTGLLEAIDLAHDRADDPVAALGGEAGIVVVDATPGRLAKLAGAKDKVRAFTEGGGWLVLWGVDPKGLASFNELVGVDHVMRPWRQERASIRRPRDPLARGVSERDVAMTTGRKYMRFMNTEIPSDNAFTHVVDFDDIAPFCEFPPASYFKHKDEDPVNNGHSPLNMVNGMTSTDMWRFIFYIHLFDDPPLSWSCKLPRKEAITGVEIVPNGSLHHLRRIELTFDGGKPVELTFEPYDDVRPQSFDFQARSASSLGIELLEWGNEGKQDVVGIDQLAVRVKRSDEFYDRVKPLLTAGVLNRYPQGAGGIVLMQVKAMDSEVNPENVAKKRNIVKGVLSNLYAAFGSEAPGGPRVDPDEIVRYERMTFPEQVNLRVDKGHNWPVQDHDLSKLPIGTTRLDGVPYEIYQNQLAPGDDNIIALGTLGEFKGPRKLTLPIDRKADALFLLHTLVSETTPERAGIRGAQPVVLRYTVTYADGRTLEVPIRLGTEVGDWLTRKPAELPGARVAWQAPTKGGRKTVLYHVPWANPRPDVRIRSVAVTLSDAGEKLGMVVVAGMTAGMK